MEWGHHLNALNAETGDARQFVLDYPTHLKILSTALDVELVKEWRECNPTKLLVYREWFPDGTPGEDWWARCNQLAKNAESLLLYGVIVETPWNEEMFADDLIPFYGNLTYKAVGWLATRGFNKLCIGNFPVQCQRGRVGNVGCRYWKCWRGANLSCTKGFIFTVHRRCLIIGLIISVVLLNLLQCRSRLRRCPF